MDASLKHDIDKVTRQLKGLAKNQIPFATSLALNQVAQDSQRRAQRRLRTDIDRPTPFTIRGIKAKRSNKHNLYAEVFIQDIQAEYLKYAIKGGTRSPKKRAIVVPVDLKLNKYGNIPRRKIKTLLQRKDVFVKNNSSHAGIYQRTKSGKLKMLVAFENTATYEPRWPFYDIVMLEAKVRIKPAMRAALNRALSSAK